MAHRRAGQPPRSRLRARRPPRRRRRVRGASRGRSPAPGRRSHRRPPEPSPGPWRRTRRALRCRRSQPVRTTRTLSSPPPVLATPRSCLAARVPIATPDSVVAVSRAAHASASLRGTTLQTTVTPPAAGPTQRPASRRSVKPSSRSLRSRGSRRKRRPFCSASQDSGMRVGTGCPRNRRGAAARGCAPPAASVGGGAGRSRASGVRDGRDGARRRRTAPEDAPRAEPEREERRGPDPDRLPAPGHDASPHGDAHRARRRHGRDGELGERGQALRRRSPSRGPSPSRRVRSASCARWRRFLTVSTGSPRRTAISRGGRPS